MNEIQIGPWTLEVESRHESGAVAVHVSAGEEPLGYIEWVSREDWEELLKLAALSPDARLVLADAIADYERSLREADDDERERWTPAVEEIIRKFDL